MASADDYAAWIVQNQAKKGTPEFDTVAKAYQEAKGAAPVMQDISMAKSIKDELAGRLDWEKNLAGVGMAVDTVAMRVKQLVGGTLNPQETANVQANRELEAASGQVKAGNIAGNLLMTGYPAASLYRGAAAVGRAALPASLAPTLAPTVAGAVTGGTVAALTQPVLPGESTAQNVGVGAAGGAVGDVAARGIARVAQPIIQSRLVQNLLRMGIVPTPGQAAGPTSFGGKLEQRAQSVLGVGDMITGGRNRVGAEFNRAAINQGVPEGQKAIQQIGKEGISQLKLASGANYDRLLAGKTVVPDEALAKAIIAAKQSPMLPLNDAGQKRFDEIIEKLFWQRVPYQNVSTGASSTLPLPAGVISQHAGQKGASVAAMPADKMKAEVIGDLGRAAQKYLKSPDAEQQALGEALMNARDAAQSWMLKSAGVSAKDIAIADTAYGAQKAVEAASKAAKARGGEFSPLQLLRSARPGSATERLAENAQAVLPGIVPNSGTIDRATLAALLLGGGSEASHHFFGTPQYLTALALAPLAYSRTGSRYALGDLVRDFKIPLPYSHHLLIPGQQGLAELLRSSAPYAANVGGTLADLLRNRQPQP